MKALREGLREEGLPGLQGLYETEYRLTDPVEMGQGLGGCVFYSGRRGLSWKNLSVCL